MKTYMLTFIAGTVIGSFTAWYIANKRYEEQIQKELEYLNNKVEAAKKKMDDVESEEMPDYTNYMSECKDIEEVDYTKYSVIDSEEVKPVIAPYVIAPEDFGDNEDYETISLTYYADERLVDDKNVLVDDVKSTVGHDCLTSFGEYEEDSVFVRNDNLKCDFEILLDTRYYSDVQDGE